MSVGLCGCTSRIMLLVVATSIRYRLPTHKKTSWYVPTARTTHEGGNKSIFNDKTIWHHRLRPTPSPTQMLTRTYRSSSKICLPENATGKPNIGLDKRWRPWATPEAMNHRLQTSTLGLANRCLSTISAVFYVPYYRTSCKSMWLKLNSFYRAMQFSACAVLGSHVVCLSVCLSVTLVNCDHIGWKSWKLTARTISHTPSLFVAKRRSTYSKGNMGKFWGD